MGNQQDEEPDVAVVAEDYQAKYPQKGEHTQFHWIGMMKEKMNGKTTMMVLLPNATTTTTIMIKMKKTVMLLTTIF